MNPVSMTFDNALADIASRAQQHDIDHAWPTIDLSQLHEGGAMRWSVAREFGGEDLPPFELHLRYEKLATASVATALVLSQRDAAVGMIDSSPQAPCREEMLTRLAKNDFWSTIGIAQLTTSRQGGKPVLSAEKVEGGYRINGFIPWCTGGNHSTYIATGAAMENGQRIFFLLPQPHAGVTLDPPMDLVALSSTHTGSIQLHDVYIENQYLLRQPGSTDSAARKNGLTLGQTFIATGLTQSALDLIAKHQSDRAQAAHDRFAQQLNELRMEIALLCQPGRETDAQAANARLRGACNDLALRVTHTAVALYKGTALLRDHPAQRLAREAMFLLVWSCPNPVIDCTVDLLTGQGA